MKKAIAIAIATLVTCSTTAFAAGWNYDEQGADWIGTCQNVGIQSPINIDPAHTERTGPNPSLRTNYGSAPLDVQNNGHTIQVNYAPGSSLNIGSKTYHLLQFHFHAGSENTIGPDGAESETRAAAEVHFVHMDAQGSLAVLGVLIEEGDKENPAIGAILHTEHLHDVGKHPVNGTINARDLLPAKNVNAYYNFIGSLTTPPCTEGVNWYIAKASVSASKAQIEELQQLMWHEGEDGHAHPNYRTTQSRADRVIREKGQ